MRHSAVSAPQADDPDLIYDSDESTFCHLLEEFSNFQDEHAG